MVRVPLSDGQWFDVDRDMDLDTAQALNSGDLARQMAALPGLCAGWSLSDKRGQPIPYPDGVGRIRMSQLRALNEGLADAVKPSDDGPNP